MKLRFGREGRREENVGERREGRGARLSSFFLLFFISLSLSHVIFSALVGGRKSEGRAIKESQRSGVPSRLDATDVRGSKRLTGTTPGLTLPLCTVSSPLTRPSPRRTGLQAVVNIARHRHFAIGSAGSARAGRD